MSHPRLHLALEKLFDSRTQEGLTATLGHPAFEDFKHHFKLQVPTTELVQVFTHTSFSHEYGAPHQEQLEFLGDAVLQLILTDELCQKYPEEKEGQLSKKRSTLVNEKSLSDLGSAIGLSELILVGKGEYKKNLHLSETVIADTVEALIAQIYRHQGLEFTRALVLSWFETRENVWSMKDLESFDAKSKLQEKSLALYKKLPEYTSESAGEEFLVKLFLNGREVAHGVFPSKKGGEKALAQDVLKKDII